MTGALRTAGCPAAERNVRTKPTGGASPVLAPVGVDSPLAQLRQQGRAVPLKRRRKVRDEVLGRDGAPSQSSSRKGRRQTLNTCLVQPARGCLVSPAGRVDARFLNEPLAAVSRASSAISFTENWIDSVPSGVRPLDFRDHIPVMPQLQLQVLTFGLFHLGQHIPDQFRTQHVAGKLQKFRERPSVG